MNLAERAVQAAAMILAEREFRWRIRRTATRFSLPSAVVRQLERDSRRAFSILDQVHDLFSKEIKGRLHG